MNSMKKFVLLLTSLLFVCFINAQQLFTTTNTQNAYKKETRTATESLEKIIGRAKQIIILK